MEADDRERIEKISRDRRAAHESLLASGSKKQLLEAIDVAVEMGGGPATVARRFALKALEYYFGGSIGR